MTCLSCGADLTGKVEAWVYQYVFCQTCFVVFKVKQEQATRDILAEMVDKTKEDSVSS
jgi:hypothetical protein